jgi:hypothetical protein
MKNKCLCGCRKEVVKENNKFIAGHQNVNKKISQKTKIKMSRAKKGKNNPMYGKNFKGKNNPHFGRKHTIEAKQKIREKAIGRKFSFITLNKNREAHLGNKNHFFGKHHTDETIQKIKLKLSKGYVVTHHINGNHKDNRNCNKLKCLNSYHSWLHRRLEKVYGKNWRCFFA